MLYKAPIPTDMISVKTENLRDIPDDGSLMVLRAILHSPKAFVFGRNTTVDVSGKVSKNIKTFSLLNKNSNKCLVIYLHMVVGSIGISSM